MKKRPTKLGGRKKNSSSINTALKKVFAGTVDIKINGVSVSVPAIEALALRTLQQCLTGPFKANEAVRTLAEKLGPRDRPALDTSRLSIDEMRIMLPLLAKMLYIGMTRRGQTYNVVTFRPRKRHLLLGLRLAETEEMTARIEALGIETQPYDRRERAYRLQLTAREVASEQHELTELISLAIQSRGE